MINDPSGSILAGPSVSVVDRLHVIRCLLHYQTIICLPLGKKGGTFIAKFSIHWDPRLDPNLLREMIIEIKVIHSGIMTTGSTKLAGFRPPFLLLQIRIPAEMMLDSIVIRILDTANGVWLTDEIIVAAPTRRFGLSDSYGDPVLSATTSVPSSYLGWFKKVVS